MLIVSPLFLVATHLGTEPDIYKMANLECLATNIYKEARGEKYLGKLAVAKVTVNRATDGDICKAVYAPYQFSWTITNKNLDFDVESAIIAFRAVNHKHQLSDFTATHYHSVKIKPKWAKKLKHLVKIGNHIFYEEI
jgi:N-acetylmuramoyl-L-alanine amidase